MQGIIKSIQINTSLDKPWAHKFQQSNRRVANEQIVLA